ncbi:MAG: Rossmann-like domain-containing protein [Desulfomonilaceae bacterium]
MSSIENEEPQTSYYSLLRTDLVNLAKDVMDEEVEVIWARTLTPREAIGKPDRTDFPLLKGKEVMIEAVFQGTRAHAYTDMPGHFRGSLRDAAQLPLKNNFERGVFIATFNAVMRRFGKTTNTVHCKDSEPTRCADQLPGFVREHFGNPRIAFVGYQPAMIDRLSRSFRLRVIDLDEDNIGAKRCDVLIEGPEKTEEVLGWGELILATGSTCVNGSILSFVGRKPVVFYGVTVAGAAAVNGYQRFCPCST